MYSICCYCTHIISGECGYQVLVTTSVAREKTLGVRQKNLPHLFSPQNSVGQTSMYLHQHITARYSPQSFLQAGFGDMPKYFNRPMSAHHWLIADITLIVQVEGSPPHSKCNNGRACCEDEQPTKSPVWDDFGFKSDTTHKLN